MTTTNEQDGIYQQFGSTSPAHVYTCAWIYINQGAVGIGSGYGAHTIIDATLYKTGSWEVLNVGNSFGPEAIEMIVYGQRDFFGNVAADFYIETIRVLDASGTGSHNQCAP